MAKSEIMIIAKIGNVNLIECGVLLPVGGVAVLEVFGVIKDGGSAATAGGTAGEVPGLMD